MTNLDASNSQFWNQIGQIGQQGNFNLPGKFTYPAPKQINIQTPNLPVTGSGNTGGSALDKLMNAISQQESSGSYTARNKDSGALGRYQVLPSNVASWSQAALGHSITPEQFYASPQYQDQIARYELGQYLSKYGAAGAAAAWYGGEGAVKNMYDKTPQNGYPSMYDYVMSVLKKYGGI